MKKRLVLSIICLFFLTGCELYEYDFSNRVILTDVDIVEIDQRPYGKDTQYYIIFTKDKGKKQELLLSYNDKDHQIEKAFADLKKTSSILTKDTILFDLLIEDDEVISVSLSKNRK